MIDPVVVTSDHKKLILCLQLPDWKAHEHTELALGQQLGGTVFTVPDEHKGIIAYINSALNGAINNGNQLALWPSPHTHGE